MDGIRELGEEGTVARRSTATSEVKRDILVATRQYAKRQLTWFRREPNLQAVMLTGSPSLSSVLRTAAKPSLL